LAQNAPESESASVKFPKRIKHRNKVLATIYGKSRNYPRYRLAYYVAGRRRQRTFNTYSEAKTEADRLVRDLAQGSQATALTGEQSRDALAALERLQSLYQSTGRRVSLLGAVSEYVEASGKLNGHGLGDAVAGFLSGAATVQRKGLAEAIEDFIKSHESKTKAGEGQRAQLSSKYHYNRAIQLRRFAAAFPATAVCDLSKPLLDSFIGSLGEMSAKSRNHHRAAIRQFLAWNMTKDFLSRTHRLFESEQMTPERANTAMVEFYTARELQSLLDAAEGPFRALVAIGGLAGLRTSELLRLTWADVWRVPGHIEVTAQAAKTRQRRLVATCPALKAWLTPFKQSSGKVWTMHEIVFQEHFRTLCEKLEVPRKPNGLRHAFCTYHFALHANENQTAAQAGNSPAMIHAHYKGLATKAEAVKWFAAKPKGKTPANILRLPVKASA
jgi:integrase